MKKHQFYQQFANMPLDKRTPELLKIYKRINELGDKIRPSQIELDKLLEKAEDLLTKE